MAKLDQRVNIQREVFQKNLPQIQLTACRVEKSDDSKVRRLIIEGNPVLLGAILPRAEIGGLTPLKLMASANGKIVVGLLKGKLTSKHTVIDYGFTRGECRAEEVVFTSKDCETFDQTIQLPVREASTNRYFRKATNFLAMVMWKIKKLSSDRIN